MLRWLFFIAVALNLALFAWFEREAFTRSQMADRPQGFDQSVANVTLLSEVQQNLRERRSNNQALPSALKSKRDADSSSCIQIQNFPSQQALLAWQARLPADVAVITSDQMTADEYWVYIEPQESLSKRQEILQNLRGLGLEVSLVQRGEHKGSLSLGRYGDRDLAVALYEGVLSQGYDAKMLPINSEKADLSLWISLTKALSSDLKWLDQLLIGTTYQKSEKKVCEGVASRQGHE